MKWLLSALLCLLLCGCSILDRSLVSIEEHSSRYWESEAAGTIRAESYQDIVNDLLILIGRHTETAILRLYSEEDDLAVADSLERATTEVQQETPMGSYAVEYITCTSHARRSCYEVDIQISYRRTLEQIQSVVSATSTAALPSLLQAALEAGQSELAVRIGYWNGDDALLESIAGQVREALGLTESPSWAVACYPAVGKVGLVEFMFQPDLDALTGEFGAEPGYGESAETAEPGAEDAETPTEAETEGEPGAEPASSEGTEPATEPATESEPAPAPADLSEQPDAAGETPEGAEGAENAENPENAEGEPSTGSSAETGAEPEVSGAEEGAAPENPEESTQQEPETETELPKPAAIFRMC